MWQLKVGLIFYTIIFSLWLLANIPTQFQGWTEITLPYTIISIIVILLGWIEWITKRWLDVNNET